MQRLRLLGPVYIDHIPEMHKERAQSPGDKRNKAPRFRSRRTIALLGYLAVERRPIGREQLALLFWPDGPATKGRGNLRRELHNLAQILPGCWELDHQVVAFVPANDTVVDLYQLQQLAEQERWDEAADWLGGEFLEGLFLDNNPKFENWLLGERERWRWHSETVLRRLIKGHTQRGRYTDALHFAQRLLQIAPWDEEVHRQIMRFMAWIGQRGAALRQFEICKKKLQEELGIEPSSETNALCRQIQAGKCDLPPQLPAFLTTEKARHAYERPFFVGRERELAQLKEFLDKALAGQGQMVFISGGPGSGKTSLLDTFLQRAMANHPNLLIAGGKCNAYSGVGDPYLPYRDAMAMLTGDVEGRWDAGTITTDHARRLWAAFPLVVQALLDCGPQLLDVLISGPSLLSRAMLVEQSEVSWLSRLQKQVNHQQITTSGVDQSYLFQQFVNVLHAVAQERPLLLFLDDIQWADIASISLLFHLGRSLANSGCRLLITSAYRPEEVTMENHIGERHPLAKVLAEFKRIFGNVWIDLDHVETEANYEFVNALLDVERNRLGDRFRSALFDRTGGNPLFTVELLRAMKERSDLLKNADGAWVEGPALNWQLLPARVEAAIEERVDRLDPELQNILAVASVEGEVFTAQVVAEVLNMPEKLILRRLSQDLERQHRLVREQQEAETDLRRMSHYRFGHILFQEYLYKRLGAGERQLLHGNVAAALETLYEGQLDETVVQLAHHFYQAKNHSRAYHYATQAAERAVRLYESQEAIRHYTRAIRLAKTVSPDIVSLTRLYRGRGLASERLGAFDQAQSDHATILEIARAAGERRVMWCALLDLGKLWESRDYNQARDYFEAALQLARRLDDPACLSDSLNWMGNWHVNAENPLIATAYHEEALEIVATLANRQKLANTLDLLGIAHLMGGNLAASAQNYDQAIAHLRQLGGRPRLVYSLTGRAATVSMLAFCVSAAAATSFDAASAAEEAIQIAGEIGLAPGEAWGNWALGMLCIVQGHFGRALEAIQKGLGIASEIEHREYVVGNLFALGLLYCELFAPEQVQEHLEKAVAMAADLRSSLLFHLTSGVLVGVYLMQDELQVAQTCLETVITPRTPMDALGKRYCWAKRAELALLQDDPALALEITDQLIASAPGKAPGQAIPFLWRLKGEALAAMGHREKACLLLNAAIENAQANNERFLLWRIYASLGRIYLDAGQTQVGEKARSKARELIDELATTIPDKFLRNRFSRSALVESRHEMAVSFKNSI